LSYECLRNEPDVFFDYYRSHLDARSVEPNAAHKILAQWEKDGKLAGVVTWLPDYSWFLGCGVGFGLYLLLARRQGLLDPAPAAAAAPSTEAPIA
jgi:hypothetical protein